MQSDGGYRWSWNGLVDLRPSSLFKRRAEELARLEQARERLEREAAEREASRWRLHHAYRAMVANPDVGELTERYTDALNTYLRLVTKESRVMWFGERRGR